MPKFNLWLLKTLILNFAYIHSRLRKLGMFILFQKCQLVYPKKVNSPPIRHFQFFKRSATTLGSREYLFLIDTGGSRRSLVNEARSAGRKK